MTPIEVLDEVLSLLANDVELKSPDASAADIGEVFLKKHPELKDARFYSDLFRILAKLKKDSCSRFLSRLSVTMPGYHILALRQVGCSAMSATWFTLPFYLFNLLNTFFPGVVL